MLLGEIAGAAVTQNHHGEAKKSRAEKDDPDGVKELCELVGDVWKAGSRVEEVTHSDSRNKTRQPL